VSNLDFRCVGEQLYRRRVRGGAGNREGTVSFSAWRGARPSSQRRTLAAATSTRAGSATCRDWIRICVTSAQDGGVCGWWPRPANHWW